MVLNSYARMLDAPGAAAAWEVNQADADVLRGLSAVVRHAPPPHIYIYIYIYIYICIYNLA